MPTQAPIRRDPRNTGNGISTHHGFTVVELMIAIAVVAIITSLALPSYRTILEKRQVTSGAEQLSAFFSAAPVEAIKHNQFVAVTYKAVTGGWCLGMRADDDADATCDCEVTDVTAANACAVDGTLRILNSSTLNYPEVLNTVSVGNDNTIAFDPVRGLAERDGEGNPETVKLGLVSDDGSYALDVEVSITGRVKICSNKVADKDVPGYKECSA